MSSSEYGEQLRWQPAAPRFRLVNFILASVVGAIAVWVAAALVPGVALGGSARRSWSPRLIGILNAVVPPVLAALRLPFMLVVGFICVLLVDALLLQLADAVFPTGSRSTRSATRCWRAGDRGGRRSCCR